MSKVIDVGLVALALLASMGYAISALGPQALRRRVYATLARLVARAPASWHLSGMARRLDAAADKAVRACGGCASCGTEPAVDETAPEVRVPLEKIAKPR